MINIRQILMIVLVLLASSIFFGLLYQYWYGENGYYESIQLTKQIQEQQQINEKQLQDNKVLQADVEGLKQASAKGKGGLEAVEEHARLDLGLVKSGEIVIQILNANDDNVIDTDTTKPVSSHVRKDAIEPTE